MEISTKFNIGDVVWFMDWTYRCFSTRKITGFKVSKFGKEKLNIIYTTGISDLNEDECYFSKEELNNAMFNKLNG